MKKVKKNQIYKWVADPRYSEYLVTEVTGPLVRLFDLYKHKYVAYQTQLLLDKKRFKYVKTWKPKK